MFISGEKVNTYYTQKRLNKPVIKPASMRDVTFLGNKAEATQDSYQQRIPAPIYNFFKDLPKYELHSHFNGATPLYISKSFLNKEGKFIGTSEAGLQNEYDGIRKNSNSLKEWLDGTYKLKASNITTMDIMNASYAIAMAEANQNARYVEVRVDPYSGSFVGSPEDVLRAVETGLKNAQEDCKEQGKELKTSILLLAERHAKDVKDTLRTARLATKMKSQRVLFEKIHNELKASTVMGKAFDQSDVLDEVYSELRDIRSAIKITEDLTNKIYNSETLQRKEIAQKIDSITRRISGAGSLLKDVEITQDRINGLYQVISREKGKTVSAMDLVSIAYSTVLDEVKAGKRHVVVTINPFDKLYEGSPEDLLRAVQVGLRNAKKDLEENYAPLTTTIVLDADSANLTPAEAKEISKLAISMKSQRVLFEKMSRQMDGYVQSGQVFTNSVVLNQIRDDKKLVEEIKTKVIEALEDQKSTKEDIITLLTNIIEKDTPKLNTKTANLKSTKALQFTKDCLQSRDLTSENRKQLVADFSRVYNYIESYIQEKTSFAEKIYDNLRHLSTLKLADRQNNTKTTNRFLRMGCGVIPNVKGLCLNEKDALLNQESDCYKIINSYNNRKPQAKEKVAIFETPTHRFTNLANIINDNNNYASKILQVNDKDSLESFDEASIHTVHSKEKILKDLDTIKKLVINENNPDQFVKLQAVRSLKAVNDKLPTQRKMQEQKFMLTKRIFDTLSHYSGLKIQDIKEKTNNAERFMRMGIAIIPNIVGYDIAGNEEDNPTERLGEALRHIKYYNETKENLDEQLKVTVHAGEVPKTGFKGEEKKEGWKNIESAIELGAHRIGHGIDLRNAPEELIEEVKQRHILMETCPKVNFQTKAVEGYRNHPILDFLDADIPANINTDNPVTAGTNLTNEFVKVFKRFNWNITAEERAEGMKERFTLGHIKKITHNAIWSAFGLSAQEKAKEEEYAMNKIDELVKQYSDKVELNDNKPIMIKVQDKVIAFTGNLRNALINHINKNKVA